uniref:Mortality factor 4-like protein 1 n=1 Tax=Xenopsylla cheopis TaxID=163159 RepID=A0A6M2DHC5_XENCH
MAPKFKFSEGEKVLCFHGPLIYEAKCLKSSVTKEKQIKYLIHYAGWNKNWDEWVPESRVLKYNETNVQKQKEVQKAHSTQSAKAKKTAKPKKGEISITKNKDEKEGTSRSSTPSQDGVTPITPASRTKKVATPLSQDSVDTSKRKRSRVDTGVESEDQFMSKVEIKVKIPDELQPWLVDDWDAICRQRKLFTLPARHTVSQVIEDYIHEKQNSKSHNSNKESAIIEVARGILEYFNSLLGSQLLYKFERQQYAEILVKHPNAKMADIYGCIHLLRLFVRLGSLLVFTQLDEKSILTLMVHVQDFLKYLVKNSSTLFNMDDFVNPDPDYHRKMTCLTISETSRNLTFSTSVI